MANMEHEDALRAYAREDEMHTDLLRASLDSAKEAIRSMLVLNGGASIALLGFLAATFSEEFTPNEAQLYSAILESLAFFAGGSFAAVLTAGLAYIVNSLYAGASARKKRIWVWPYLEKTKASQRCWFWGQALNWVAVVTGGASLIAFVCGLLSMREFVL
ncbi:MAG: hypothetical protein Rhirs2KO_26380 [Rhizobiaceae bacterium]